MSLGEEGHRGKETFSSHIKSVYYQYDLQLLMLTLIIWPRSCFLGVSIVKLLFFPLSLPYFLGEVTISTPYLSSGKLCFSSLRMEYPT